MIYEGGEMYQGSSSSELIQEDGLYFIRRQASVVDSNVVEGSVEIIFVEAQETNATVKRGKKKNNVRAKNRDEFEMKNE